MKKSIFFALLSTGMMIGQPLTAENQDIAKRPSWKRGEEAAGKGRKAVDSAKTEGWNKADKAKGKLEEHASKEHASKAKGRFGDVSDKKLEKLTRETNHHERRMAKIDRIEELAREKNNDELLRATQKMRAKETERHMKNLQNIQGGE